MQTTAPNRMKRLTAAALSLAAFAGAAAAAEPALIEQGRAALDSRCARCHAIGADGTSPHAEAPPFREVVKRYPPESLAESLAEGIVTGHADMPTFVLSPEEVGAVVAYLETLLPR